MNLIFLRGYFLAYLLIFISCQAQNKRNQVVEKEHLYTNALIHETSPYLLQHAHNPVDWHAWNNETLQKAQEENKLLLISVGYSACHWCHVMEQESFEDTSVAILMNKYFVCIKVDREERPDVDAIYMDACQLINQSGGWPLNAIALPDGRPIYALTYLKKTDWVNAIKHFSDLYAKNKAKAEDQAKKLTQGIIDKENIIWNENKIDFNKADLEETWNNWKSRIDYKNGGRNGAPKFPMSYNYDYLMQDYNYTKNSEQLKAVTVSLDKMMMGGIYDHVGGGFARYSTDELWKVPHFEKMLYDNAQLVSTYAKAYALTKNEKYAQVVDETLEFIAREMTDKSNGFYSSLDADSEGKEGLYYVWTTEEIDRHLDKDAALLKKYWNCTTHGNWENKNILFTKKNITQFADQEGLNIKELEITLKKGKKLLLQKRAEKIRPSCDDKILTSWNALMLKGYIDAYRYLGNEAYLKMALKNANFLKDKCIKKDYRINRNYKNGVSSINGFLDDYSFTIEAFIALYEISFDEQWLNLANNLSKYTIEHFYDHKSGFFFYTSKLDQKLIARKKELQDNVIPSSNSSMAKALYLLSSYFDNETYREKSNHMLHNMKDYVNQYGTFYSNWAILMHWNVQQPFEIAIVGKNYEYFQKLLMSKFLPNSIFIGGKTEGKLDLLQNKLVEGDTYIYVCKHKVCKMPVKNIDEALLLIK